MAPQKHPEALKQSAVDPQQQPEIELVPELAGRINGQCVEQLFSGMKKNNYFL